jgi:hypothetical protein
MKKYLVMGLLALAVMGCDFDDGYVPRAQCERLLSFAQTPLDTATIRTVSVAHAGHMCGWYFDDHSNKPR